MPRLQIDETQKRDAEVKRNADMRSGVVFIKGGKNLSPEDRGLQSPRIFYHREPESHPFLVAKP
ncbi:MAG: hypothetical protein LH472_16060 [Pyrinomonadaceae bacterium]|nr:hypothetical protein [Pyrinomonadaceae bacterium]